jgi:perosamine synthetase
VTAAGVEQIPLARPILGPEEEERVLAVLRSGQLSLGPVVGEFERAFAARVGAAYGVAVSSGTAGLHLALRAVGVSDGDEVITSPFSFVASANVALYERARPVFADIDPVTLNADPAAVAAAVTSRTAALLPVHVFGYPADMEALERLGLPIVEDACEALGATYADGVAVGARGHQAVFAFYANKQLTTGEGGMVTTSDAAVRERLDSERNQGRAPDMGWLDHDRLGDMLAGRARVAELYREALAGIEGLTLPCPDGGPTHPGNRRGWFVFVVQLPREVGRDDVVRSLAERSIPSKPYFPAIHLMSFYRQRFGYREGQFPVCEDVAARSIALPFFPTMTEGQVARVATELRSVLGR